MVYRYRTCAKLFFDFSQDTAMSRFTVVKAAAGQTPRSLVFFYYQNFLCRIFNEGFYGYSIERVWIHLFIVTDKWRDAVAMIPSMIVWDAASLGVGRLVT